MGAWGTATFENDDALDWAAGLDESADLAPLEGLLSSVAGLGANHYLEAPEASAVLAAAEVVASLRGRPPKSLPEGVEAFVRRVGRSPSADLVTQASRAVERVRTNSELRELWDESDESDSWQSALRELESRLV